jgi:hypothetical protein
VSPHESPTEHPPTARHLAVMWICWVVLAIFLVTAGVCAFL